ncbi:MAG TPA: rhomboid family intramembrane serine protease [Longimicrobiales bacterium]|nr:rhomboid family intramembrane serine protease [Longimicrobiales bacterium]
MAYRGSSFGGFGGFSMSPWVGRLLIANTVVFLLQNVIPSLTMQLAFVPALTLVRPWTLITYMFAHGGFGHLIFNMIALFFFGPPLEDRLGSRGFLIFWLVSGLGGAALSFFFAYDAPIIGASAGVYGVLLAFAMFYPDMPIYIWGILPVKAKWLVAFMFVLSLMNAVGGARDGVAHFAHLGGLAGGYLYLRFAGHRRYGSGGMMSRIRGAMPKRRNKNLTVVPGGRSGSSSAAPPPPQQPPPQQRRADDARMLDQLDRVLDKISTQGIASLTADERRLLDEASKRYRQN